MSTFDGTVHLEQYWGDFNRDTVIPIASASKWYSAAVVMSLVDDGMLSLDDKAGELLPDFANKRFAKDMTVRQAFSHTGGAPGLSPWQSEAEITLAESAAGIAADARWSSEPGSTFLYGGVSMQVIGAAAEVVGGDDWESLFTDRIATPLGITDSDYQGTGPTTNPRIAGGAQTSIESYTRLLRMLVDGGAYDGQQVLSSESVDQILSDQTGEAVLRYAPSTLEEYLGYGLGTWIVRRDGNGEPVDFASPGAYGATPWIDLENRYFGVFLVQDDYAKVAQVLSDLRAFTRDALTTPGDYNRDGVVDGADFVSWREGYGSDNLNADGNRDGVIDAADYVVWRDAAQADRVAPLATPEAATAHLLIVVIGCWPAAWRATGTARARTAASRPPAG